MVSVVLMVAEAAQEIDLQAVGKIFVATMQIVGGFTGTLGVSFPINFKVILTLYILIITYQASELNAACVQAFLRSFIDIFRFDISFTLGVGCLGKGSYVTGLATNLAMLCAVVLVVFVVFMEKMRRINNPNNIITKEEELEKMKDLYHRFDPDGDGISWTEMNEIVNKIDDDITEEETQELFERADTDGGGLIDFDEFYAAVHDDSQAAKGSLDLKKLVRKQEKVLIRADAAGRVFLLAFLLYPGLTQKIFDGFGCRDLGYGQTVLMVDYTIDCETAEYYTLLTVCIGLMFAWSIGLPVILWLSMFSVRKQIREEDEDTLQMYDFILGDYKTGAYHSVLKFKK